MPSSETERLLVMISAQIDEVLSLLKVVHREQIDRHIHAILGDGTRRRIYEMCDGQNSVADMAAGLNISSPAVSQHLAVLTRAGLVRQQSSPPRRYRKTLEGTNG